ncbi:TPA: XRE family transcriptional regulator [Enterococcus faecalis]|nr:XRE family transcriptional regulator [Enterococcus faecalis]
MTENYTSIITKLFESEKTSYRIAKDTGLSTQLIDKYRIGDGKVSNMRLDTAEILVKYAKSEKIASYDKI